MPTTALVLGATGGLGAALVRALEADPACERVLAVSRREDGVDLTDEASLERLAARLEGVELDLLLVATGVLTVEGHPPERALRELDPAVMARGFAVNAIGPALALKHLTPLLPRRRRSAVGVLSARLASIGDNGLGGWTTYRASKAALNQVVRNAALELSRSRPHAVVAALHPGTIETDLTRPYARGRYTATADESARQLLGVLDGLTPDDTGCFRDYAGAPIPW